MTQLFLTMSLQISRTDLVRLLRSSVFNGRPCTDSVDNSFYSFFSSRRFFKLKYLVCLLSYKVQIFRAYWQLLFVNIYGKSLKSTLPIPSYSPFSEKYRHSCARIGSETAHSMCYKVTNLKNREFERCPPSFVFTIFLL